MKNLNGSIVLCVMALVGCTTPADPDQKGCHEAGVGVDGGCPEWVAFRICTVDGGDTKTVNTSNDGNHCGACGIVCPIGGRGCQNGRCLAACPKELPYECDGTCVDLNNNPNRCGSCRYACPPNKRICSNGMCMAVGEGPPR